MKRIFPSLQPPGMTNVGNPEIVFEREVEGQEFRFVATRGDPFVLRIVTPSPEWQPLVAVVETFWPTYAGIDFIDQILDRAGIGADGIVAFAYQEEGSDEVAPGCVRCYFFDDELEVSERFFEAFVLAYGRAYLEAARRLAVQVPRKTRIRKGLRSLARR